VEPADALIDRAKNGDRDAFGALIQPALTRGFRLALGVLGDRQAAEDATQDAVVTAWRKIGNVREGAPIEPWFLAIVANRCRRMWRYRNRHTAILRIDQQGSFVGEVADRLDVQDALAKLTPQQRVLVVLRFYFDLPVDECAGIAGIPVGTAKSRLHRALANLRLDLTGEETSHGRNPTP
jgi:RNA polymerase sigma-70 factor, ECF subfamily